MIPYFTRLKFAFRTFFSILDDRAVPADVASALGLAPAGAGAPAPSPAPAPAPPPSPAATQPDDTRAAQILAILQRDGRLVDFLMENLDGYADDQVGAAVRTVHAGSRQALQRYLTLEPVVAEGEGARVTVEPGTDPAMVKVVGNAPGRPPYQGVVRHRGWLVSRIELPPVTPSARYVVAPAEVEVE